MGIVYPGSSGVSQGTLFDNSSERANLGKHSKVKKWINKKDIK